MTRPSQVPIYWVITPDDRACMKEEEMNRTGAGAVLATALLTLACEASLPVAPELTLDEQPQGTASSAARNDLAALRRATAPFRDFARAQAAGYSAQITACLSDPVEGGMGFHYGNPAIIDGAVSVTEPELLLYEPQADGSLRFVAVEYIVPFGAWAGSEPPELFGQHFHRNEAFGIWALHVWAWRQNPSGLFADWNPHVSCAAAGH